MVKPYMQLPKITGALTKVCHPNLDPASSAKNTKAVLFVHGFWGNSEDTWKDTSAPHSFPDLICGDPKLLDYDAFVFNYQTTIWRPPKVDNIARQLQATIDQFLSDYDLVLVAHSMGGLVCMQYIVNMLSLGKRLSVSGLLMYGTPMSGVEWVRFAKLIGGVAGLKIPILGFISRLVLANRQLTDMEPDSEFIQRLLGEWILRTVNGGYFEIDPGHRVWIPVRVVTGNEDWVVTESSARGVYGQVDWMNVPRDHVHLVKPQSAEDDTYQFAAGFLAKCREWKSPEVLYKLRQQVDWMWKRHEGKLIRGWNFNVEVAQDPTLPIAGFGLPGFDRLKVHTCYSLILTQSRFRFGFALGRIAAQSLWRDEFAYLHRFLLGALDEQERNDIVALVKPKLNAADGAWSTFFRNVCLRVRKDHLSIWCSLDAGPPQLERDGIVCDFVVPEAAKQLMGREVELDISFESLMPATICNFTVDFPWLCDGFDVQVSVDGHPSYLVASPHMIGGAVPQEVRENLGSYQKAQINSSDLVMPKSQIVVEWQRSPEVVGRDR